MGNISHRGVAFSTSERQGSNFESCLRRAVSSHRSDTITMWSFHIRDWPRGQFAARAEIAHVAISAFIHRAFIFPFVILFFLRGVSRHVWQPSKHETLNQCWFNAGLSSAMLAEHLFKIGSTSHIF